MCRYERKSLRNIKGGYKDYQEMIEIKNFEKKSKVRMVLENGEKHVVVHNLNGEERFIKI